MWGLWGASRFSCGLVMIDLGPDFPIERDDFARWPGAYAACKTMLLDNRILLDELTEMLVEKETVDYQEMQGLIGKYYPDGVNEKMVMPAEAALM